MKYSKILHHVDSSDMRNTHVKKLAEKKRTEKLIETLKSDWKSELEEGMQTINVYQKLGDTSEDGELEDQVIDASLEASFADGPQNGMDNIMFRGVDIKDSGSGVGANGGFNIGKHLAFSANTNSDGSWYNTQTSRHAMLAPIDGRNIDTLTITAIRGNDSNGGELPDWHDENLELLWYAPNDELWHNGDPENVGGTWQQIKYDYDGNLHNDVNSIIIPVVSGDSSGYDGSFPGLRDWTIEIPEWCRRENVRFMLWQMKHSGHGYDHYGITQIKYRARAPKNAFVALDKPEASSFVRLGPSSSSSPKKRKKKLEDQLKASKKYTEIAIGKDFPGMGATLDDTEPASPMGSEEVKSRHAKAGTLAQQLKKALASDAPDAPGDSKTVEAIKAAAADNAKSADAAGDSGEVEKGKYGQEEYIKNKKDYDIATEEVDKLKEDLKDVRGLSDAKYKNIRYSRDLPTNKVINSVAEVLRKVTGGFSLPVDLTLKYALGDMTPVTKSPGKAYDQATLNVLRSAHASRGTGIVKSGDYSRSGGYDSLLTTFQTASVQGAKNNFSYQVTDKGIRILDTFNFTDPKNPASTTIGAFKSIPGAQWLATKLVEIGDWKAKYSGNDPRDESYGVPVDYTIPMSSLTQSDKDLFFGKQGSAQRKWVDTYNNTAKNMNKTIISFQNKMDDIVKEQGKDLGSKSWQYRNLQKKSNEVNEFITEYTALANRKDFKGLNSLLSNENIPSYVKTELGGMIPQYNDKGEETYEPLKNEYGVEYNPDHEISEETLERFSKYRIYTNSRDRERAIAQAPYAYSLGGNSISGIAGEGMKVFKIWGRDTNLYEAQAYSYWDGIGWTPSHVGSNHWQGHAPDGYFSRAVRYLYDPKLKANPEWRARFLKSMEGILNGRSVGEQIAYYRNFGKTSWRFAKWTSEGCPERCGGAMRKRVPGYYHPGETYYQSMMEYWKNKIEESGGTFVDFFDTDEWKGTGTDIEPIDTEKDTEDTDTEKDTDKDKDTDPKKDKDKGKSWIKDLGLDEPIFTHRDSKKKKKESIKDMLSAELKDPDTKVVGYLGKLGKTVETYARYLTNTLPEKIDNNYLGDKHVNRLIKDGQYNYQTGVLEFGDNILGTTQPPTREGNQIVVKFNYDFNNNAEEMALKKDTLNIVQKTLGRIVYDRLGKYSMDATPELTGIGAIDMIGGAILGKGIETSKLLGGGKHTPGELRIDIKQLKKDNLPLYNDLSVKGLITGKDDGLVPNSKKQKVVKEDIIRWRGTPKPKRKKSNFIESRKFVRSNKVFGSLNVSDMKKTLQNKMEIEQLMFEKECQDIEETKNKIKENETLKCDWRKELKESDWTPISSGRPTMSTAQTFQHTSGGSATFSGLGGAEVHPDQVTLDLGFGETIDVPPPTYAELPLAGVPHTIKAYQPKSARKINVQLSASEKATRMASGAAEIMKARVDDYYEEVDKINTHNNKVREDNINKIKDHIKSLKLNVSYDELVKKGAISIEGGAIGIEDDGKGNIKIGVFKGPDVYIKGRMIYYKGEEYSSEIEEFDTEEGVKEIPSMPNDVSKWLDSQSGPFSHINTGEKLKDLIDSWIQKNPNASSGDAMAHLNGILPRGIRAPGKMFIGYLTGQIKGNAAQVLDAKDIKSSWENLYIDQSSNSLSVGGYMQNVFGGESLSQLQRQGNNAVLKFNFAPHINAKEFAQHPGKYNWFQKTMLNALGPYTADLQVGPGITSPIIGALASFATMSSKLVGQGKNLSGSITIPMDELKDVNLAAYEYLNRNQNKSKPIPKPFGQNKRQSLSLDEPLVIDKKKKKKKKSQINKK